MDITIKNPNSINEKIEVVRFPCEEEKLDEICNRLGIEMTTKANCQIVDSNNKDFLKILQDSLCNIDELNYLMKRMDSFDSRGKAKFYAAAFVEDSKKMADLVNLSFNTHCYSLVSDFSNLNKIGKDLYLSEKIAVSTKEFDELDGEAFAMEVIKNDSDSTITPYGVLYKNSNELYQVYDGKHFPPYQWQEKVATVQLTAKGAVECTQSHLPTVEFLDIPDMRPTTNGVRASNEYIYLPCSDIEINKALMRLETPYLQDCEVEIDNHNFPDRILNIVSEDLPTLVKIDTLNNLASHYEQMNRRDIKHYEKLIDYINPKTIDEILALTESMYEFEIYDGINDANSYGRYMICESGHFEYDNNLEEYIDFKRYGENKIENEVGAFSKNGYIF